MNDGKKNFLSAQSESENTFFFVIERPPFKKESVSVIILYS